MCRAVIGERKKRRLQNAFLVMPLAVHGFQHICRATRYESVEKLL